MPLAVAPVLAAPALTALYAAAEWGPQDVTLATAFTAWCLPQVLFYGIFAVLGQILQTRGRPHR